MFLALVAAASLASTVDAAAHKFHFHGVVHVERFMVAVVSSKLCAHPERLFQKQVALATDSVGRGFFISANGTVWTRGTEDYGHNGVVKLRPDGTLIVALSDVPALRRDDVAQSRALGDELEATLSW